MIFIIYFEKNPSNPVKTARDFIDFPNEKAQWRRFVGTYILCLIMLHIGLILWHSIADLQLKCVNVRVSY